MSQPIFISYRQKDSKSQARAIKMELERPERLGPGSVFMDITNLSLGDKFPERLRKAVDDCGVLLVVIGPQWTGPDPADGPSRIMSDDDWARIEVRLALEGGKVVAPVLLDDMLIPAEKDLPGDLWPLRDCQVERLRDAAAYYEADLATIAGKIMALPALADAVAKARRRTALPPEYELPIWTQIERSEDANDFREFLTNFPEGKMARFARQKLEQLEWERIRQIGDLDARLDALNVFASEFEKGKFAAEAGSMIAETRTTLAAKAWTLLAATTDIDEVRRFLEIWGDTPSAAQAMVRCDFLEREQAHWRAVEGSTERAAVERFLGEFVGGFYTEAAYARIEEIDWLEADGTADPERIAAHARTYPAGATRHGLRQGSPPCIARSRRGVPHWQQATSSRSGPTARRFQHPGSMTRPRPRSRSMRMQPRHGPTCWSASKPPGTMCVRRPTLR